MKLRNLAPRAATGAYILHSGIEKWSASDDVAAGVHGMGAGAYPFLKKLEPPAFLRALSIAEMATGAALLTPFVSPVLAGLALTGFSGALVTMYLRTPALRQPGSVWPNQQGIGVSKDIWMLGIGIGLVVGGLADSSSDKASD